MKGSAKQQWGQLTDDDLSFIDGSRDKFLGRLQERYGISKEQAQNQINEWIMAVPADASDHQDQPASGGVKTEAQRARSSRN